MGIQSPGSITSFHYLSTNQVCNPACVTMKRMHRLHAAECKKIVIVSFVGPHITSPYRSKKKREKMRKRDLKVWIHTWPSGARVVIQAEGAQCSQETPSFLAFATAVESRE